MLETIIAISLIEASMVDAILAVVGIAIVGSGIVPIAMLTLARFGYFEPIQVEGEELRAKIARLKNRTRFIGGRFDRHRCRQACRRCLSIQCRRALIPQIPPRKPQG